jgi:hypothetical protein
LTEIRSLHEKLEGQLSAARQEARDLNRRRIDLDRIEHEIGEAEGLLEETRRALEVIRLESGRALPGYAVVMSPASEPLEPSEDTRKMLTVAGGFTGGALALLLMLFLAFSEKRIRYAETLVQFEKRIPVLQVSDAGDADPHSADLLRNELQLHSLRKPRLVGIAPVIAVTCAGSGATNDFARSLAQSFARARMKTLFVDADIGTPSKEEKGQGWREVLAGAPVQPQSISDVAGLWILGSGSDKRLDDRTVSAPMVRSAIEKIAPAFDVVIVSAGSLQERLSAQFILSNSDVGVLKLMPADRRASVFPLIDRLESLPRNGSVAVMRNAEASDPWLAIRT